jgi:Flp pilus assembly pilin Flp
LLYPENEQPRLALSKRGESIMNIRLQDTVSKSETSAIAATRQSALRRARQMFRRLGRDQRGANLLEYGMLACLIAVAGFTVVQTLGTNVQKAFEKAGKTVAEIGK